MNEEKQDREINQGRVLVSKIYSRSGDIIEEENSEGRLEVNTFNEVPLAQVTAQAGLTLNLGNYESVKVGINVSLPTYVEEIDDAIATAIKIANTKLDEIVKPIREHKAGR